MIKSCEEILADIDATLDRLIENGDVIQKISIQPLFSSEVEALQKTQESLLARLLHMQNLLKGKPEESETAAPLESIEQKMLRFGKLNAQMIGRLSHRMKRMRRNRPLRVRPHRRKVKSR